MSQEEIFHAGEKRPRTEEDELDAEVEEEAEAAEEEAGLTPQHVENLLELGGVCLATRRLREAVNVFDLICQVTLNTDALFFRGLSKFYQGQNEEALADIRAAIQQ